MLMSMVQSVEKMEKLLGIQSSATGSSPHSRYSIVGIARTNFSLCRPMVPGLELRKNVEGGDL